VPALALGISLACLLGFLFVPSVIALYESRGSPPVSMDSALVSLGALIANIVVLVLIVAVGWRSAPGRER
jgi:predicted RND superfamily exporter protein